jgi:Mg-chelatase subunit ChlD
MSMKGRLLTRGIAQGSMGALALLFVAAALGLTPLAGLSPEPGQLPASVPALSAGITGALPAAVPANTSAPTKTSAPDEDTGAPTKRLPVEVPARSWTFEGAAQLPPVSLDATLSQGQLVRGSDGALYLYCGVAVADETPGAAAEQAADLVLVLDTSGSMQASMDLLRQATLGLAERLGDDDRLMVVTYARDADLLYSATGRELRAGQMFDLRQKVDELIATGGTYLEGGLRVGARELREHYELGAGPFGSDRAHRIILLTDGKPTVGATDARSLNRMVADLREQGLGLSVVGLGLRYDAGLMASMADTGGGRYHYVESGQDLGGVYQAELESMRTVVAGDAVLRITPREGVRVAEVYSWANQVEGELTPVHAVSLGDLSLGRELKVVARLEVDTDVEADGRPVADVSLTYVDLTVQSPAGTREERDDTRRLEVPRLSVGLTGDEQVAQASAVDRVQDEIVDLQVADRLAQARAQAEAGHAEEARALTLSIRDELGRDAVRWEAPDGRQMEIDVEGLADGLGAADTDGEDFQRASMGAHSANRELSR